MFTLTLLVMLAICAYLTYQLAHSQDLINEFRSSRIERVSGWCYQQLTPSIRGDRRKVAIQFPVPEKLIKLGIKENISALVFQEAIDAQQFDLLCSELVNEVLNPNPKIKLIQSNPEWRKRLHDFYINLDDPTAQEPLKKLDSEVKK